MKRILFRKNRPGLAKAAYMVIFAVIIITVVILVRGISGYGKRYDETVTSNIRSAVLDAIVTCYALEGRYPETIDHLAENYGLVLDRSRYIYHYEIMGSNIFPEYDVIPLAGNNGNAQPFIYREEGGS